MADDKQFTNEKWLELADGLLDRLRGRVSLFQPREERQQFIAAVLDELYGRPWHEQLPQLAEDQTKTEFLRHFISYAPIEGLLQDPQVEDIMINATQAIFVHKTGVGLVKTDLRFKTTQELTLFVKKLIIFGGRTELDPINDVELSDIRGRVNIVRSPFGPQITITRAKERPLSVMQLIENGAMTHELAAQLWMYIEGLGVRPANVLISGGPGTGKTTLLNALLSFIPWQERLVVIEDTLELNTNFLENCARLETDRRTTMEGLVKNSLRMRPDRILVGEVRGTEAQDLMTAVSIGKYCIGTLHASSGRETILRMQSWPMNVPEMLVSLIDVFIIMQRVRIEGKVVRVVGELVETAGMEQKVVLLSPVWAYDQAKHQIVESSPSSVYRDKLAQATGLSAVQIMQETARRAKLLRLMHTLPSMTDIDEMTAFCQLYSTKPDDALAKLGTTRRALEAMTSGRP